MLGLSLIEILVTVLVLSIGLLGIAGMQAFGMRYNHDSYARSQATTIANELIERMHANPDAVSNGDYEDADTALNGGANCTNLGDPSNPANPAPACTRTNVCTVTELAQVDVFRMVCGQFLAGPNTLIGGVTNLLPNGRLAITCTDADAGDGIACTGDNTRIITISWQDPDDKGNVNSTLQVQINARFL